MPSSPQSLRQSESSRDAAHRSPLARSFESDLLAPFHAVGAHARLAPSGAPLPAAYAATLAPFAVVISESGESGTFSIRDGRVELTPGAERASTRVELAQADFEGLTRDLESAAGLIYAGRAQAKSGDLMDFMQWEPALRWVYGGRAVYDPGAIDLRDRRGEPLDPTRSYRLDDDREEMAHFLRTVGYLHVRDVLSRNEIERLSHEAEILRREAREGDQESWWGRREDGSTVLCRVLRAGRQPTMRSLHGDARIESLASLCDVPMSLAMGPEEKDGVTLLWKQPGVVEGLGDLPWHRDCGLGGHASMCPTAVVSVFLGPNTPEAGELRFLPGSWQTSFPHQHADSREAPRGVAPKARAGDATIHYGDVAHVAPPPTGTSGPYRSCILLGYTRQGGGHHDGGRHYNDILLGDEKGQIADMRKVTART
ncbi:phytanoyl-CoA dioxygenase family protein [Myxococcota bacterium]|nr:phytanoyl-CoA dioxygenase family protein [Myxococcota bacterium]